MQRIFTAVVYIALTVAGAGCFQESRQPHLTVTGSPSILIRLVDQRALAAALERVASRNDMALGIPEATQREFFEALGDSTSVFVVDSTGKIDVKRFPLEPFLAGFDGAHLWIVSTSDAHAGVIALTSENQGGLRALKTLTARPAQANFFAGRLMAEAEVAMGRRQFDVGRNYAQAARLFAMTDRADILLSSINHRQAEMLLERGEAARIRKDYRTARAQAGQASSLLPDSERLPATALLQRVLEDEGGELRTFARHRSPVTSVAFSPDGRVALSASEDKTVRVWDVATGREIYVLAGHRGAVRGVAFSPDGRAAVSGGDDGLVKVWDVESGQPTLEIDEHGWKVTCVAFSRDGKSVLCGSEDYHVKLWDASTGRRTQSLSGHGWKVTAVAFSPTAEQAISASDDSSVRLWNMSDGVEVRTLQNLLTHVKTVAFSPDGRNALSGGDDRMLTLWNLETGREVRRFKGHTQTVTDVAFSADGQFAVSGSADGTARLWRIAMGEEVRTFNGHAQPVSSVAFSPDGHTVLTGGADATVTLWQLPRDVWPSVLEAKQ